MDLDFTIFQLRVATALTPNVPLDSNLRALVAPALDKLIRYSRATVGVHLFVNPEVGEAHALVLGVARETVSALLREEERRHGHPQSLVPASGLPEYVRFTWKKVDERQRLLGLLSTVIDEHLCRPIASVKPLHLLLTDLYRARRDEFPKRIDDEDSLLVLPLRSAANPRLGYFLLWSPANDAQLRSSHENPKKQEGRVAFRLSLERLLVRLFTNYYRIRPDTYLPSYCRPESKYATVLCASLRHFESVSALIQRRTEWDAEQKSHCIRDLIRRFNETVSNLVRRNHGRVDQSWGDGILCVFGEYLDTKDDTPRPGCRYALETAAGIVEQFDVTVREWLEDVFKLSDYVKRHASKVRVSVGLAIHHGEVTFDYVGGADNLVYVALGSEVSLVRQLALHEHHKPILLSQSAATWSADVLRDEPGMPVGSVRKPSYVKLPGHLDEYEIYPIGPANIDLSVP